MLKLFLTKNNLLDIKYRVINKKFMAYRFFQARVFRELDVSNKKILS